MKNKHIHSMFEILEAELFAQELPLHFFDRINKVKKDFQERCLQDLSELSEEEKAVLEENMTTRGRIRAIKSYRERTGASLSDAKSVVDKYFFALLEKNKEN